MRVRSRLRALAAVVLIVALMPLAANGQEAQGAPGASVDGPRVALIIGNGDYEAVAKLSNPTNDAADIGDELSALGFDAEVLTNADLAAMEDAVLRLRDRLATAPDSVGFFYYAGHGVQSGGENYLIPVDARLSAESLLRTRAIPLQFVLDSLGEAGNALNIVVLDACRDNPFSWARSSSNRGLAVVGQLPPASIVVYSTSAGKVAQDGSGRNGAFTEELLKHLATPGLDITEVLRRTGQAVQIKTNGAQIPAIYSQFFGFMQLAGGATGSGDGTPGTSGGAPQGSDQSSAPSVLDYLPAFYDDASMGAKLAIAGAEELTWSGKWLSAWKILDARDPSNLDPYILAEKIRIALNGNSSDNLYKGFTLYDAPPDGDTEAARQAGALAEEYVEFDPDAAVRGMEARGVAIPPVLASALGNFYYNAWYWYGNSYSMSEEETKAAALRWYDVANEAYIIVDLKDVMQYAELLMDAQRADEAVTILKDESEYEPDDVELRLKLIEAYTQTGRVVDAFVELDGLIQSASFDDAARDYYSRALSLAFDLNDQAALTKYLAGLEARLPGDWLAGVTRHRIAVSSGDKRSAQSIADDLMTRFPLRTDVLESLLLDWLETDVDNPSVTNDGLAFLNRWIGRSVGDSAALGIYYLYRALYRYYSVNAQPSSDLKTSAIQSALLDLDSAEMYLSQSPDANQDMRDSIQYIREELSNALK